MLVNYHAEFFAIGPVRDIATVAEISYKEECEDIFTVGTNALDSRPFFITSVFSKSLFVADLGCFGSTHWTSDFCSICVKNTGLADLEPIRFEVNQDAIME